MSGMLNTKAPHKTVRHPDFGQRYVQDGMLFFMDGSPMGLPENHRTSKPAPALATSGGRTVAPAPAGKAKTKPGAAAAATTTPPAPTATPAAPAAGVSMSGLSGEVAELEAALHAPFFSLKKFMRTKYGVDPQNKDTAMQWLRDNGKLAA